MNDTLSVRIVPAEVKRICIEAYADGTGWYAYAPRSGRVGAVYATAMHKTELLNWAQRLGLDATVL